MLLSVVSVLFVAQSSSEVLEGPMNNPIVIKFFHFFAVKCTAVLVLTWTGPEGSCSLGFPDFKTINT